MSNQIHKANPPGATSGWTRDIRLRKHADYQRVYHHSRKQFSSSMSYFFWLRPDPATPDPATPNARAALTPTPLHGPRVGLTAGRVMGKAVDRNRIKRRMREAVRLHIGILACDVDVILHPRRSVLTIEFSRLEKEVARIFGSIQASIQTSKQGSSQSASTPQSASTRIQAASTRESGSTPQSASSIQARSTRQSASPRQTGPRP